MHGEQLAGLLLHFHSSAQCILGAKHNSSTVALFPAVGRGACRLARSLRPPAAKHHLCCSQRILVLLDHPVPAGTEALALVLPQDSLHSSQLQSQADLRSSKTLLPDIWQH